ncbi:hypothetical protein [Roseivirga sp.]|uniref:hypothetical protein n=1 Tax=Roseivirga sp. TaxID=1964215 RepID=UPI003B8BB26F
MSIKETKALLKFTFLNFLDKGLNFLLPLAILLFFQDNLIYNEIEYVLSVALILATFADLGFRSYLFYGYKESVGREEYFLSRTSKVFNTLFLLYVLSTVLIATSIYFVNHPVSKMTAGYIGLRFIYIFFTNYKSVIYRFDDKPSRLFRWTIPGTILSLLLLLTVFKAGWVLRLDYFFFGSAVVLLVFFLKDFRIGSMADLTLLKSYFFKVISYSWPLILNGAMVSVVNNFGKIYAFNSLSDSEMSEISLMLRIGMIIQLAHLSSMTFFSKKLFLSKSVKESRRTLGVYLFTLLAGCSMACVLYILFINLDIKGLTISFRYSHLLVLLFFLLSSIASYFEVYLNKNNRNIFIPLVSFLGICSYASVFVFVSSISVDVIIKAMSIGGLISLLSIVILIRKFKLFV